MLKGTIHYFFWAPALKTFFDQLPERFGKVTSLFSDYLETLRAGNLSGRAKAEPEKFGPSRATGQEIWKFSGRAEAEPKKFLVGPGRARFFSLKRLFLCNNLLKIIQKLARPENFFGPSHKMSGRAEPSRKAFEKFRAGPSPSQRLYYCRAEPGSGRAMARRVSK